MTPPMKPSGKLIRQRRRISPSSGFSSPAIMLISVVLPVPLGARIPSDWPSSTRNDTRSRITLRCVPVQKDLLTLSNSSIQVAPMLLWPHPLIWGPLRGVTRYVHGIMPDRAVLLQRNRAFLCRIRNIFEPNRAGNMASQAASLAGRVRQGRTGRCKLRASKGRAGSGIRGTGQRQARGFQMFLHDIGGAFGFAGADRVEDL